MKKNYRTKNRTKKNQKELNGNFGTFPISIFPV